MTTISSVNRTSETRRARRAVPLITCALFQDPSGTYVPTRGCVRSHARPHDHATRQYAPRSPHPNLTPIRPHPHPTLAPPSHSTPQPHTPRPNLTLPTQNSACNSITLNFNIPHKRCNSNDHNSIFEIDPGELHARLLGNHGTTTVAATPSPPPRSAEAATGNPATASLIDANQMRKGSFLTSPKPFHHEPRPSVSPALVSGIRMRTRA